MPIEKACDTDIHVFLTWHLNVLTRCRWRPAGKNYIYIYIYIWFSYLLIIIFHIFPGWTRYDFIGHGWWGHKAVGVGIELNIIVGTNNMPTIMMKQFMEELAMMIDHQQSMNTGLVRPQLKKSWLDTTDPSYISTANGIFSELMQTVFELTSPANLQDCVGEDQRRYPTPHRLWVGRGSCSSYSAALQTSRIVWYT